VADTLGWLLLQQGKVNEARELLAKAAVALKGVPVVRYHYAAALARSGDKERARSELNVALSHKQPFEERDEATALMAQLR
jgi:predicted Zn-dependent protease